MASAIKMKPRASASKVGVDKQPWAAVAAEELVPLNNGFGVTPTTEP